MTIYIILSIVLGITALISVNVIFELHLFSDVTRSFYDLVEFFSEQIGNYNTKRYIARVKREKIVHKKENFLSRYNRLVENLIMDFDLPLTLESFTSLLALLFIVMTLVLVLFSKSITVAVTLTISLLIALLTYLVMQAKTVNAQRLEWIMDAEDLICPLAGEGVLNAIKKVMESSEHIDRHIRPYFQQFIDNCDNNGYSFRQAMELLNRQLGPKFSNFAKKAVVFEYNERKGMSDIFLDIVDENAVLREMNNRKDRIFRKMNRDFLLKTTMIVLFFLYALSSDGFREFMLQTNRGKVVNTLLISIMCVSFARTQSLQGNFNSGGDA